MRRLVLELPRRAVQKKKPRLAAAEEGVTTTATRAAAAAAQETDVCSVCQYRGRKLKHT